MPERTLEIVLTCHNHFEWGGAWRLKDGPPELDRPHTINRFLAISEAEAMLLAGNVARRACHALEQGEMEVA